MGQNKRPWLQAQTLNSCIIQRSQLKRWLNLKGTSRRMASVAVVHKSLVKSDAFSSIVPLRSGFQLLFVALNATLTTTAATAAATIATSAEPYPVALETSAAVTTMETVTSATTRAVVVQSTSHSSAATAPFPILTLHHLAYVSRKLVNLRCSYPTDYSH